MEGPGQHALVEGISLRKQGEGRRETTQISPHWDPARMTVSWEPGPWAAGPGCTYVCVNCFKVDHWVAQQTLTRQLITSRSNPMCRHWAQETLTGFVEYTEYFKAVCSRSHDYPLMEEGTVARRGQKTPD